jgi:hypothetical protein
MTKDHVRYNKTRWRYLPGCCLCRRTISDSRFDILDAERVELLRRFGVLFIIKGSDPDALTRACAGCMRNWRRTGLLGPKLRIVEEEEQPVNLEIDSIEILSQVEQLECSKFYSKDGYLFDVHFRRR